MTDTAGQSVCLRFLIGCFNKLFLWFVFLIRTAITQPSNEILMNMSFLDYFRSSSEKTDSILKLKSVFSPVKTHLIVLLNTFYLSNRELKNRNINLFVCILVWYKGGKKRIILLQFPIWSISASIYLFWPWFIWKCIMLVYRRLLCLVEINELLLRSSKLKFTGISAHNFLTVLDIYFMMGLNASWKG